MQPLSSTLRAQNISLLENTLFDVLVIGGGVTGAGVALDAAARGYKVALVEKIDFASGTSSKSTKLVHGGIRYLPNFDFALVAEGLTERGLLLENAPFLVRPLEFVLPIYKGDRHPVGIPFTTPGGVGLGFILNMGLLLYDVLANWGKVGWHHHLRRNKVMELAPALITNGLKEGFTYYDAQTNDARLTLALLRSAAERDAVITNYTQVTSFLMEQGKISGAHVTDQFGGKELIVHARHVINAAGIFAEQVEALTSQESQIQISPSKGVHLVLAKEDLKLGNQAIVLPETDDKRILFIVPWESRAVFGTTDTGTGDLDHPVASKKDITYLLAHLNRYLSVHISEADIISVYAGYRPLVRPRNRQGSTAKLSRTHVVVQNPSGMVSIVGGKLTTYRRMAQDTVDVLNKRDNSKVIHPTRHLLLQGTVGWAEAQSELEKSGKALGLSPKTVYHLGRSYGSEALKILEMVRADNTLSALLINDLPYIRAEVIYACRYELAMTPYDILARRTSITLEDRQRGLGIVEEVAQLMATELHWTTEQQQSLVTAFRTAIQQQIAAEQM